MMRAMKWWLTVAVLLGIYASLPMAMAHAEPLVQCFGDRVAVAGGATSCDFAHNVRSAWFGQPCNPVLAYSPTTGQIYSMMCVRGFTLDFPNAGIEITNATRCVDADGGSAIVYVW